MNEQDFSTPLPMQNVTVTDPFWERVLELVRQEVLPYQWDILNDRAPDASPSWYMATSTLREHGRTWK